MRQQYLALAKASLKDAKDYESLYTRYSDRPTPAQALDTVPPVLTGAENKRLYNTLSMGGFNLVLLKTCKLVDLGPMSQVVSRIVAQHFDRYWATNYAPQLEFDATCSLPERKV
jgi:hypothetical protein